MKSKMWVAIKNNLIIYGVFGVFGVIFVIYLMSVNKLEMFLYFVNIIDPQF